MDNEESRVIVTEGPTAGSTRVYHRDFPEISGDGQSVHEAATRLTTKLKLTLDSALTDWRRDTMNHAIADVEAFVKAPV